MNGINSEKWLDDDLGEADERERRGGDSDAS